MTMNHETHTFRHARGTYAAFTATRSKWYYGELLHNIGWNVEDDCGKFLLEDASVATYKIKVVDDATLRVQKGDFQLSEYKRGLEAGKHKLRMARIKIAREAGEYDGKGVTDTALGILQNESYRAFRIKNPIQIPKGKAPPRPAPLYRVGTCVAAEKGPESDFLPESAKETHSGWCRGKLHAFKSACADRPYVIRWATKPFQDTRVSQTQLQKLIRDHNHCAIHHKFDGILGNVLFWPCKDSKSCDMLRLARVMSFSPGARMYTLNYKDGVSFKITPEHLDFAAQQSDHLRAGKLEIAVDYRIHPLRFFTFTLKSMESAEKEAGNFKTKGPYGSDFSSSSSSSETSDTLGRHRRT